MPAETKIGGTALLYCIHNRAKKQTLELPYDGLTQEAFVCICCLNLFIRFKSQIADDFVPVCNVCKPIVGHPR